VPGDFRHPSITPPTRPPHDFGYTPADLVDTYTPPEAGFAPRHTSYAYNADGQLTAVTRPDGQQLLLSYEASGRLDFVTLPTGVVDLSYDAASGRVSAVSAPGGFQSTFGYEGPLLTSIATSGPVAGAIGFSYDADLRLAGRTVAGSAPVAYQYDPDGLLVRAGELALGRETASGWLATTALGVTSDERTRTGFGELDVFTARIGGSVAYAYDLDRDAGGRITRRTETIGGATAVWEYGYHAERGWLTEVRRDGVPVASYGYDGNGNRTSWSDFWGSGAATYDAQDRQLTAGAKAFTYTANGERLTESEGPETTSYTYDVRGSLLGVELPDGIAIEYLVDASGRRIGKRVDGVLTQGWLYAGGLAPVAETDGTGSVTKTFVYGGQGHVPDYLVAGGTTYRMLTDHLGSVRLVVDATSGAVVQRLDYDAWGRITYDSNPGWQPFGFAGGLYDPQTGLVRFGARDYDPETGRWTAKDPIGFGGGSGLLYEYCANDPVNALDPTGLLVIFIHGTWSTFREAFPEDFVKEVTTHFSDSRYTAFSWSGKNYHDDRAMAGQRLAEMIGRYQKRYPDDPIRVVAHSHGGNVALVASQASDIHFNLVTLGTPIMTAYGPGPALDSWHNVYSPNDFVQTLPFGAKRTHQKATNIKLLDLGHSDLHTVKAWKEAFENEH